MTVGRRILVTTVVCLAILAAPFGYLAFRLAQPFAGTLPVAPPIVANAAELERDVRKLAIDFRGRNADQPAVLEAAAAYVEGRLQALGHAVESQRFEARGRAFRNLVVRLGPDTPEVLVVGAHYDVFGALPGADDNASGVAGLIALARLLKDQPLKQRVELVVYTNEEPPFFRTPFMGSAVHASSLKKAGKRVTLMLSLECIAYFNDAPGSQAHPVRLLEAIYPTTGNFIALVGFYEDGAVSRQVKAAMQSATPLPVHSINAPGFVVGVDFSDHLNYAQQGFVGMMVTDTAFYRNKAYHTSADTPERLDYVRMAQVVTGVAAAVLSQAGAAASQ